VIYGDIGTRVLGHPAEGDESAERQFGCASVVQERCSDNVVMAVGYDDDFPSCEKTYATLRALSASGDPHAVTNALAAEPSECWRKGDHRHGASAPRSGWLLTTEAFVQSRDLRRHLDWLVDRFGSRRPELAGLRSTGWALDVPCYWLSAYGHGGPTIDSKQMTVLAQLELSLWLDVYFLKGDGGRR